MGVAHLLTVRRSRADDDTRVATAEEEAAVVAA